MDRCGLGSSGKLATAACTPVYGSFSASRARSLSAHQGSRSHTQIRIPLPAAGAGAGGGDQRHQRRAGQSLPGGATPPRGVRAPVQMGTVQPADLQVAAGHAARDPDRHPARRALLLSAAPRLRRARRGPDLRHRDHRAHDQPVPHRGEPLGRPFAPGGDDDREPAVARLHRALRPAAHLLLFAFPDLLCIFEVYDHRLDT